MRLFGRAAGNFDTARVDMSTSASTRIVSARANRIGCVIQNDGTTGQIVYIGATEEKAGSTAGFPLAPGASIPIPSRAAVYGRAASGSPKVSVIFTDAAKVTALNT